MQDKRKVTLYLPSNLSRQLKIRSAVDGEAMSVLAERAIDFYLKHAEVVDRVDGAGEQYGQTHQIHVCPSCSTKLVLKGDQLSEVANGSAIFDDQELTIDGVSDFSSAIRSDEGELVPC